MVRDPLKVYAGAEEMAAKYREQMNAAPQALEEEIPSAEEEPEIPEEEISAEEPAEPLDVAEV
jgi:small subunit ribosomal protein S1